MPSLPSTSVRPPTTGALRRFALELAGVLFLMVGFLAWRGSLGGMAGVLGAGAILIAAIIGLLRPARIRPVHKVSTAFSHWMGHYVGGVVLTIFFFLVLTPLGLVLRWCGHNPLALRARSDATSYWHRAVKPGPLNRMF